MVVVISVMMLIRYLISIVLNVIGFILFYLFSIFGVVFELIKVWNFEIVL